MLSKAHKLAGALNTSGVRYCHWKGNASLEEALSGLKDLDLLIHRPDADIFRAVVAQQGFRPACNSHVESFPAAEHYFGLDTETGMMVHVHACFNLITGESLAQNFRLPVEDMLLANTRLEGILRVPAKAAELVVFTIRTMLKHTTCVELALLARDRRKLKREIAMLADMESLNQATELVKQWLPNFDPNLFGQCVSALKAPAPLTKRLVLARRLRSSFRMYARHSQTIASWTGLATFTSLLIRRLVKKPKRLSLRSGGALVAFVGPEATGKSTLINEVSGWLNQHFAVERIHAGKPCSAKMTLLPNIVMPLLRVLAPALRPSNVEGRRIRRQANTRAPWVFPITFAIRSVLLAYDRRALLSRAFARAANGTIVLCDRYPFVAPGAPDGPRLIYTPLPRNRYPIRNMLAALELKLYQQIPDPNLVICLKVPVEIAIARNRARGKREPEDYVRRRHSAGVQVPLGRTPVHMIDTNHQLEETLRNVKKTIWNTL